MSQNDRFHSKIGVLDLSSGRQADPLLLNQTQANKEFLKNRDKKEIIFILLMYPVFLKYYP